MLVENDWPRAHIVVDDFFAPKELATIFAELPKLERRMQPGLVRDLGHDGQSVFFAHPRRQNRAVWIHDPSKTLRLFRERLWSAPMVEAFEHAREPLFQIIPHCWAPHLQVSSYMTGDHYDFHEDEGAGVNLTAIVFLAAHPKKVQGGDLVLAYDGEETTIDFRQNRLVIFPSKTLHRVTPVRIDSKDPRDARISLQCWLAHGRPPARPTPRAPEADRPTFLLAEAPIIASAQALVGRSTAGQSPEDLYWGAFYVSRILSSNLRALGAACGVELGSIRIHHGEQLEVSGRGKLGRTPIRVGFLLHGPDVAPAEALSLFAESKGRRLRRAIPAQADEVRSAAILRRLCQAACQR